MRTVTKIDDILIFSNGNNRSIGLIIKQIRRYEQSSGQQVNNNKSYFLTAPKTAATRINRMRAYTKFMEKEFPFTYLGCPVYVGRKKIGYFDNMVSKVMQRLNGWKGRMLSHGGRIVLIKNVLQALPTYNLSALVPPKGTLNLLEKYFANFFWGSNGDTNKYH